jgi:CBS domain-containing protein
MIINDILNLKVGYPVRTLPPNTMVGDAIRFIARNNIGCVVVSDTGNDVKGLLTERMIVAKIAELGMVCLIEDIATIMQRTPPACRRGCDVDAAAAKMHSQHLQYMPVVERGRLVGLVSLSDLVNARLESSGWQEPRLSYA